MTADHDTDRGTDPLGAFCTHDGVVHLDGAAGGPLGGVRFAAKDLFEVAGTRICAGNPDWLASHAASTRTAPAIQRLVDAGATLVGKALTDELAYSIVGSNAHYGTPTNVNAPGCVPGGSSSGSAAAVAGALVDAALGTDTGGSTRVPASLCGLFGLRPTHGSIPLDHTFALAPSFDTVGTFARDLDLLRRLDAALRVDAPPAPAVARTIVVEEAFALADDAVAAALHGLVPGGLPVDHDAPPTLDLDLAAAADAFRRVQGREFWQLHGAWVEATDPTFGPGIRERVDAASRLTDDEVRDGQAHRAAFTQHLDDVAGDAVLVLPTTPTTAPPVATSDRELDDWRSRTMRLTSIANLTGRPQLNVPITTVEGRPVGLSLLGPRHSETVLFDLAATLVESRP